MHIFEDPTDRLENVTVSELMHYGYLELRYIIEWAKKVPGKFYIFFLLQNF